MSEKCESCEKLKTELAAQRKATEEAQAEALGWRAIVDCRDGELHAIEQAVGFYGNRGELVRVIAANIAKREALAAELDKAVGALQYMHPHHPIVAAYDAKRGEVK